MDNPKLEMPGLAWRKSAGGKIIAIWRARADIVRRGYLPKNVELWRGTLDGLKNPLALNWLSTECTRLQDDMLEWSRAQAPVVSFGTFDGTLHSLVCAYQADTDSSFQKIRYHTKQSYSSHCRRLDKDHGKVRIAEIKARDLLRWHAEWTTQSGVTQAHTLITMLRTLFSYGTVFLENKECAQVAALLREMRFKMPGARQGTLSAEQAVAVRAKAHELGKHSMALAQAFQFELMLRQRDVIGEWVPIDEPGTTDIKYGQYKWLRGLRWSEIDENLILRHTTSKRQKDIEVDLKLAPMVMEELAFIGKTLPQSGAVVKREKDGLPWSHHTFRKHWRAVARKCGIPDHVYNMDSRAGGITEATDAGAELEHVRHAATHSDVAVTQRYSRGSTDKVAKVMKLRAAHREQGANVIPLTKRETD